MGCDMAQFYTVKQMRRYAEKECVSYSAETHRNTHSAALTLDTDVENQLKWLLRMIDASLWLLLVCFK